MGLTRASYAMINGAPINVFDYGATGNGSTDDTAAIQAAFAAVPSSGKSIYFPAGTYKVSGPLNVPANSTVYGDGMGTTTASTRSTVIYGTHDGKILNCVQDGFTIRDLCVKGPNNAAYTESIGIYTATTSAPAGAMAFVLQNVSVLNCYDNININASYVGVLQNVISQWAQNVGIRALCAQGQWNIVNTSWNKSTGVVFNNYAGVDFNSYNASPTIVNFGAFNNGGAAIVVEGSFTGYDGTTQVCTQGLTLDQFFINNDALGEIILDDQINANQVYCANISNGQIQFAGCSSQSTRSSAAKGIYIGTYRGTVTVQNVNFYDSASNHIEHKGKCLTVTGCNFVSAARGVPANAVGAGNSYVPPPSPINDNNNCVMSRGTQLIMSDCSSTDPLALQGDYNRISNSWFITNYAATNSGGTATQQTPTVDLATGSIENYLTGVGMWQANTGSSASARSFRGNSGSTYSLINCQVYNGNGATAESVGSVITPYTP